MEGAAAIFVGVYKTTSQSEDCKHFFSLSAFQQKNRDNFT